MTIINQFSGDTFWLSNFFFAPVTWRGKDYITNEHFYQAHKAVLFGEHERVRNARPETADPNATDWGRAAKKAGRAVRIISPTWDEIDRNAVMWQGLYLKFHQHPDLMEKLMNTAGEILIEGNTWHDNYFGDCYCKGCTNKPGRNELGIQLMALRDGFI